jgi:phosphatidyl-myo-inositol alpha-mannosyltransferase
MRVVMASPYSLSRPGGVQGQVLGLSRELRALGVDVRVVAPCDGPPPAPGVVCVGPSVEWVSNGSIAPIAADGSAARRTVEAIRSIEPHLVHLHEPAVPGPCLSTLIGFNGPMVGTFHASGELMHQWSRPPLRTLMSRLTTRVVVSESARETAELNWAGEYVVLWNGIEIHRFADATPTTSPVPAVLFVGRHEPRKGLEVLLDAWRGLERDAVLWVASTGPQTKELRKRNVPNVVWLGGISDHELEQRMRGAAVFCAPSVSGESFGVVLLEAMAAGTPVVASAIEGYLNVARSGREGLLVEPGDVDELRVALRRVLDEPALRQRLVAAGHERAEHFSMSRLAQRYLELYEQAVAAGPRESSAERRSGSFTRFAR